MGHVIPRPFLLVVNPLPHVRDGAQYLTYTTPFQLHGNHEAGSIFMLLLQMMKPSSREINLLKVTQLGGGRIMIFTHFCQDPQTVLLTMGICGSVFEALQNPSKPW